jgi:hypothetical protein
MTDDAGGSAPFERTSTQGGAGIGGAVGAALVRAGRTGVVVLAFDQSHLAGARTFGRFLLREFHALALAQEFEHRPAYGATVEEMLSSALIANEAEAFIDEETCNRPGLHT